MNNKQVLICGHKSFVAIGLADEIEKEGLTYDCFSRGNVKRNGNVVNGSVFDMEFNKELGQYDTVINFIILKDKSVEDNIAYIKSLLTFCKDRGVKHLVQISSISVYPNTADVVTESSPIELNYHNKGGYASCGWWSEFSQAAITEAIDKSFHTPRQELMSMGNNGKRLMADKYSVEAVGRQMRELYEWIVNQSEKPGFVYEFKK